MKFRFGGKPTTKTQDHDNRSKSEDCCRKRRDVETCVAQGRLPTRKSRSGPLSRVLSWTIISLGRRLLDGSSNLPGRWTKRTVSRRQTVASLTNYALLGLASGGVYRAEPVTRSAGALLPHRFTLTSSRPVQGKPSTRQNVWRYTFCGTIPVLADGGRYPPPCPVKPGLSSPSGSELPLTAIVWPTPRTKLYDTESIGDRGFGKNRHLADFSRVFSSESK